MKNIIVCVVLAFLMIGSLCVISYAEEAAPVADEVTEASVISSALDRIFEFWELNKAEILAACSGIGAALSSFVIWIKSKPQFNTLQKSAKITDERETALIRGYNKVVEVNENQNEKIEQLTRAVESLQALVIDTEDIEKHIANMLSTAYTNSVLPQGVKDIISLEHAETLKIASKGVDELDAAD